MEKEDEDEEGGGGGGALSRFAAYLLPPSKLGETNKERLLLLRLSVGFSMWKREFVSFSSCLLRRRRLVLLSRCAGNATPPPPPPPPTTTAAAASSGFVILLLFLDGGKKNKKERMNKEDRGDRLILLPLDCCYIGWIFPPLLQCTLFLSFFPIAASSSSILGWWWWSLFLSLGIGGSLSLRAYAPSFFL